MLLFFFFYFLNDSLYYQVQIGLKKGIIDLMPLALFKISQIREEAA